VYIRPGLSETEPKPKKKSGKQIERIGGDSDGASTNGEPWWIAMIQEIRAEDERNVFM